MNKGLEDAAGIFPAMHKVGEVAESSGGMTFREYAAVAALQSVRLPEIKNESEIAKKRRFAEECVSMADALIKALKS